MTDDAKPADPAWDPDNSLPNRSTVMRGALARLQEMHDDLQVRDLEGHWIAISALNVFLDAAAEAMEDLRDLAISNDPAEPRFAAFRSAFSDFTQGTSTVDDTVLAVNQRLSGAKDLRVDVDKLKFFATLCSAVGAFEKACLSELSLTERLRHLTAVLASASNDHGTLLQVISLGGELCCRLRQTIEPTKADEIRQSLRQSVEALRSDPLSAPELLGSLVGHATLTPFSANGASP